MNEQRRSEDNWPCKKIYDRATPYLQVIGFIVLCGFTVGIYFTKYQAYADTLANHEDRLTKVENEFIQINQKLDDIKIYTIKNKK